MAAAETGAATFRADGARWSCTGYELIDETGRPIPFRAGSNSVRSGHILRDLLTMEANVTICTVLVERAFFGELGGFQADAGREDYDFLLRLAAACGTGRRGLPWSRAFAVITPHALGLRRN